jgi:hypothetical protein
MNEKTIYINASEEITSVIDKLVRTKAEEVFLVIPKGAVISQSLVNLRLLKREADNLRKKIVIVSDDEALERLAKKTGFSLSRTLPSEPDEVPAKDEDILQEQVTPDEFKKFLKEEKKSSSVRISDIVKTGNLPAGKITDKKIRDISVKAAEIFDRPEAESKIIGEIPVEQKIEKLPLVENFEIKKYKSEDLEKKSAYFPTDESQEEKRSVVSSFPKKIFAIFIISALIIAGLVFYLVLPKAEVTLTAKKDQLPFDLKLLADKNLTQVNVTANKIPAQLVKLEDKETQSFAATGERQLNEKAAGTITVYNAYSSSPQALVETTRFLSQEGKIFRLTKSVTIPGAKIEEGKIVASSLDVAVEADQPGSGYNIGPSNFSIPGLQGSPKYTGFYGKSKSSMSGGSTENVRVMTQDDFNKAKDQVWTTLQQKILTEMAGQISADVKILDGAVSAELTDTSSSVEVGGKAENFTITATGVAKALVFSETDVLNLIDNTLSGQLDGDKEKTGPASPEYKNTKIDIDKGQLSFEAVGSQEVIWKINQDEIKKIIAGKGQNEVSQILQGRPEIKEAQFSLWPFWIKSIPRQVDKIHITVD